MGGGASERGRVEAHWDAGANGYYSEPDLVHRSGLYVLFRMQVIEVPGHTDWCSLVLVMQPRCIREAITRSCSTSSPSKASLNTERTGGGGLTDVHGCKRGTGSQCMSSKESGEVVVESEREAG